YSSDVILSSLVAIHAALPISHAGLFRGRVFGRDLVGATRGAVHHHVVRVVAEAFDQEIDEGTDLGRHHPPPGKYRVEIHDRSGPDRKSTRLNSSHVKISYAVF